MAANKSRKRKLRNPKTLTSREQFDKLEQDALCFIHVADITKQLRDKYEPGSSDYLGYSAVMLTNLGMGFELKLKSLLFRTKGYYETRKDHKLAPMFDRLDNHIQSALDSIFEKVRGVVVNGRAFIKGPITISGDNPEYVSPPIPIPETFRTPGFRALLETFDQIGLDDQSGLYGRRYSFESFTKTSVWSEITIFALPLIHLINEYAKTLPEPTFESR